MTRFQRSAILISLIEGMKHQGSWCGETHIQKAVYFLQTLFNLSLGYKYILYRHGPFSFDLNDELTAMRSDKFVRIQPQPYPYGPSFVMDSGSEFLKKNYKRTTENNLKFVEFIAKNLGASGVVELERLATALYVTVEHTEEEKCGKRAEKLHELKPHVSIKDARNAVQIADTLIEESRKLLN